jgi:hypothetical protein
MKSNPPKPISLAGKEKLPASSMGDPLPFLYPLPILDGKLSTLLLLILSSFCSPELILYLLSS